VAEVGDAEALAVLLDRGIYQTQDGYDGGLQAEGLAELAEAARQRGVRTAGDLTESLNGLLEGADEGLQGAVLRLAGVWGLEAFRDRIERVAASGTVSVELRVAAIEGMSALGGVMSRERLVELSETAGSAPVRNAAIVGLVTVDIEAAAARAAAVLAGDESGARVEALMPAFLQRTEGAGVLAEAMSGIPPTRDAARVAVRLMSGVGRQDAELAGVLLEAAELGGEPPRFSADELDGFMAEVRARGDARRGAAVFRRADVNCLACHAVGGEGGNSGPDLNAIGTGQPLDFIIGAVLEPDREVKEGYHAIEVTTRDGGRHQGYVVRSDGGELVMRDVLLDREVRIRRDRIEEEQTVGSLMPSGLVDHLTRAELRDLFRYLSGLGRPGS
jgi:putative heme-binding domain-containing protein